MVSTNYDIFISYSHNDLKWVKESLLKKLEDEGFNVFIDFRDFTTGSFSVEEMQRAVLQSRKVLIVLTNNYLKSEWGKFENVMAQTLDPAAVKRKIIPVLREDCDIPLRLRILHYCDLRNDIDSKWEMLLRDLY